MNFHVHQSIIIHNLRVGSVTTSSVFQIGSSGSIKALSKFTNTGEFTEPARPLRAKGQIISSITAGNPTGNPGTPPPEPKQSELDFPN